uniref:Ubiquitin-like protease family profile domain-containing protein n=1 Tax=Cucumis melo TaxID=3656 RepID=A0A9I9E6V6_CUCME
MKDGDMIHIPMNELIFGSDKIFYLAREDLLHYYGMVEISYMCILAFHWMLHVFDLRENCVYVLDSLRSKVNEDIHGVINVGLKTWQVKHDLQRYRSTPKWRPVKCPRQLDSVGCGYYVQKYIHEIFNTKNAYRQEEIDEIRTKWAAFVSRFVADEEGTYLVPEVEPLWNFLVEIATFASTPTQKLYRTFGQGNNVLMVKKNNIFYFQSLKRAHSKQTGWLRSEHIISLWIEPTIAVELSHLKIVETL